MIFHVATLMPTHSTDPQCSNKKMHIGNNFVTIVYNDSQQPYAFGTIKVCPSNGQWRVPRSHSPPVEWVIHVGPSRPQGQFNFVEVLIEPLAGGMNRLSVRTKRGECLPQL